MEGNVAEILVAVNGLVQAVDRLVVLMAAVVFGQAFIGVIQLMWFSKRFAKWF